MSRKPLAGLDYSTYYPPATEEGEEEYPSFLTETEIKEHKDYLQDSHQLAEDLFTGADTALSVAEIAGYRTEKSTPVDVLTGADGNSAVRIKAFTFQVDRQGVKTVRFYPYGDKRYLIMGYDKDGNPTRVKTGKDPNRLVFPKDPTERKNLLQAVDNTMGRVLNTLIDPNLPLDQKTKLFDGISKYNGPVIGESALASTSRLIRTAMEKALADGSLTEEIVKRLINLYRARAKQPALKPLSFADPVPMREEKVNILGIDMLQQGIRATMGMIPVALFDAIRGNYIDENYLPLYLGLFSVLLGISRIQTFVRDRDTQLEVEKVIAGE